jgi:acyl-CoA hydrolase
LSIVEQGLKFLKGLTDKEVIKRIIKITRVDVTDPRTVNYARFYKIAIEAVKSHEVLK